MSGRACLHFFLVGLYILGMSALGHAFGLEGLLALAAFFAPASLIVLLAACVLAVFAIRESLKMRPRNPVLLMLTVAMPIFGLVGLDNIFHFYDPLVLPHPLIVKSAMIFGCAFSALAALGYISLTFKKPVRQ